MASLQPHDLACQRTRAALMAACKLLGYSELTREADDIIYYLGLDENGQRGGHLAGFYRSEVTEAIDRAVSLAREYPEALLSDSERAVLDLVLKVATS